MTASMNWRYGKDEAGYRRVGSGLESTVIADPFVRTPVERFFVYSAGHHADVDESTWSLRIHGEVESEISVGLDDLAGLPKHRVTSWLECAGNGRRLFNEVAGHNIPAQNMRTPWLLGGLGLAEWSGPRLSDVVGLAGVPESAMWIVPRGLDDDVAEPEVPRMCLPRAKAFDEDTIVALSMNGQLLPLAHGGPARLVVPGWVGAYSMKWLGDIEVSNSWLSSWRSDEYYVHRGADGQPTGPLTAHPVKSNLALDFPASLDSGPCRLVGVARSGEAPIVDVVWRIDGGEWQSALLSEPLSKWGWTPFSIDVDLGQGEHVIETRATDASGNVQPVEQPRHPNGVLWNAIVPHPITVQ